MSLDTIANLCIVIVAILAIILSWRTEKRNEERFNQSIKHLQETTAAQIRPILSITDCYQNNEFKVILRNNGLGPAIIKKIQFKSGGTSSKNILLILKQNNIETKSAHFFGIMPSCLHNGASVILTEYIKPDGYSEVDFISKVKELFEKLSKIKIELEYSDSLEYKSYKLNDELIDKNTLDELKSMSIL